MILGHLTVTYAMREPLRKKFKIFEPLGLLWFGVYLPDIVDKPLHMLTGLPGRGIAHSAIVLTLLFLIAVKLFPKLKSVAQTVLLGAFIHLLQDTAGITTILWPLLGAWIPHESPGLLMNIYGYYVLFDEPYHLAFEIVSLPFCLYFAFFRKRFGKTEPELGEDAFNTES